jgi:transcriptional antiterminator RfaH
MLQNAPVTTPFPQTRFAGVSESAAHGHAWSVDDLVGQWWVLHTRSRNEKRIAEYLDKCGVSYFLPLTMTRRTYGKRIVEFSVPLFPGYVFLRGDELEAGKAWETRRVANVIRVADQERLREDLRHVQQVVGSGAPVDLYPGLRRGRRCQVRSGPLKGVEGIVVRRRGVSRVSIAVKFISQSAEVEIDVALLDLLE